MLAIALSLLGIAFLLLATEVLWIKKHLHVETARKLVHISSGIFIALWPYWMSWLAIEIIAIAMFLGVLISRRYKLFNSIHGVSRLTRGELLSPLGIGLSAFIAPNGTFFAIAVLHIAVADGLAGLVGRKYGTLNSYTILGHRKSIAGTAACFLASATIFSGGILYSGFVEPFPWLQALIIYPLIVSAVENISWYGLDNLTIPIAVILLLSYL